MTLVNLFRSITLFCFAMGWVVLVRSTPSVTAFFVLFIGGLVLASIVGLRRSVDVPTRLVIAVWFQLKAIAVGTYSACVADYLQDARVDLIGEGLLLALAFPVYAVVVLLMLRAWSWSAIDRQVSLSQRVLGKPRSYDEV